MVLGKLPVPGRPVNLDYRRARAYCHTCDKFQRGIREVFLLFPGGF